MPQILLPSTLKRLRLQRDLTQAQVADAIGTISRTYSNWETGETEPGASLLASLAKLFDCTSDHLLGLSPHPTPLAANAWVVDLEVVDRLRKAESGESVQLSDSERRWAFAIPTRHAIMGSTEVQALQEELVRLRKSPRKKPR